MRAQGNRGQVRVVGAQDVAFGQRLRGIASACIDVSDGLAADLGKSVGGAVGGSVGRSLVRGALGGLLRR